MIPDAKSSFSWDTNIYAQGKMLNRYPYDAVVSFVYRYAPRGKSRSETRILEVGCGGGNNLWFAAREGFAVAGIDISSAAISALEHRFATEGLTGEFHAGSFTSLPFSEASFDLVVDRAALTCVSQSEAKKAIREVRRVLRPGGSFLFTPYSREHLSASSGSLDEDGLVRGITRGLTDVGPLCFYDQGDVLNSLMEWEITSLEHTSITDVFLPESGTKAQWFVICRRP